MSPAAQGIAIISVMREAFEACAFVSSMSIRAYAVEMPGMIAAATAVAIEIGMFVMTTALFEKIP